MQNSEMTRSDVNLIVQFFLTFPNRNVVAVLPFWLWLYIFKISLRKLPRPNVIPLKDIISCVFPPPLRQSVFSSAEATEPSQKCWCWDIWEGRWAFLWPAHPFLPFCKHFSRLSFARGIMGGKLMERKLCLCCELSTAGALYPDRRVTVSHCCCSFLFDTYC